MYIFSLYLTKKHTNSCTLLEKQNCKKLNLQELKKVFLSSELVFLYACVYQWPGADMTIFAAFANAARRMMYFHRCLSSSHSSMQLRRKKTHRADSMTVKLSTRTCSTLYSISSLSEHYICSKYTHTSAHCLPLYVTEFYCLCKTYRDTSVYDIL